LGVVTILSSHVIIRFLPDRASVPRSVCHRTRSKVSPLDWREATLAFVSHHWSSKVNLKFKRVLSAKVMGKLAEKTPQKGDSVRGVMVTHNFQSKIVSPEDIATFTPLRLGSIASKIHVPFAGSVETLKLFLCEMFTGVKDEACSNGDTGETVLTLHDGMVIDLRCLSLLCANLLAIDLVVARPEAWDCDGRVGSQPYK
jgi:hypothetical protein